MKVSELTGAQLDCWVGKAEGHSVKVSPDGEYCMLYEYAGTMTDRWGGSDHDHWSPSSSWQDGGPIIDRERIDLEFMDDGGWRASISEWRPGWLTEHLHDVGVAYGPTPLIAAMRSYVASKFGEEVK